MTKIDYHAGSLGPGQRYVLSILFITFTITFIQSFILRTTARQGLKWGRVARVGYPAPFDLPGL